MSLVRIDVDADDLLGRQFSKLEREQLPFAVMQAVNATAFEVRNLWERTALRVFDRPTPLTRKAVLYRKATRERLYATVFIRDEAFKGNPPAKYLLAQVEGGSRRKKAFEILLQQKGVMPAGQFAIAGRGAKLDAYGNVAASEITKMLSQLGAQRDPLQNESQASRKRRGSVAARQEYLGRDRSGAVAVRSRAVRRGGRYFALAKRRGRLLAGVYERIDTGFGSAVRSVLIFSPKASYRSRYDIYGLAQRGWNKLMPFHFERELSKALASSRGRS